MSPNDVALAFGGAIATCLLALLLAGLVASRLGDFGKGRKPE